MPETVSTIAVYALLALFLLGSVYAMAMLMKMPRLIIVLGGVTFLVTMTYALSQLFLSNAIEVSEP